MINKIIKGSLVLVLLAGMNVQAQNTPFAGKLDSLVTALDVNNKAMGQLTLAKNGTPMYNRAWGSKQIDTKGSQKADVNTKYRVGSISKMFTATMVMQLVEEGKLKLATPLANYFPEVPNAKTITIEQLLSHHSGLHNFTDDSSYMLYYTHAQTRKQMLDLFKQQEPDFEPGGRAEYSNTNFLLLGYIIEDITKLPYKEALKKRITDKIGLKNTYAGGKINASANEAASFLYNGKNWDTEPETDMSIPVGAGNVVSTTNDLTKFLTALFQYKLVSKESVDKMIALKDNYGLGVFKFPLYDRFAYGHTGGIDGFNSFAGYFPDDSSSIAFIGNGVNYRMNDIALAALTIYYGKHYEIPTFSQYQLSPGVMSAYEGLYSSAQIPLMIAIKKDGWQLTAQATGQSAFPLEAVSATEFKFEPAGIVIEFVIEEGKPITQFTLKQGGGKYEFKKGK